MQVDGTYSTIQLENFIIGTLIIPKIVTKVETLLNFFSFQEFPTIKYKA